MSPGVTGPNTFTTHFVAELTKLDHMQFNIVYIYIYAVLDIYGFMFIPCFDGYVQSSLFLAVRVSNTIVSITLEYVIKLPLPNLAPFVISFFLKSASNKEITHLLLREIQCQLFWSTTVCLCNVQSLLITIFILCWLDHPFLVVRHPCVSSHPMFVAESILFMNIMQSPGF